MRALAQIFYFLGSIPGLRFFTGIASSMSRLNGISDQAMGAKRAASELRNKEKENKEDNS